MIPKRFLPAYQKIEQLQKHHRYLGAFIFGSLARGEANDNSDVDVKVIVDIDNDCKNINHPIVSGVKLDISFQSFAQLLKFTNQEIAKAERIPMLAESIIVFDKTGELNKLKLTAQQARPQKIEPKDYQLIQFLIYHATNKAERYLDTDPASSLLAMGININDILKYHYQIQARWWVSNKRLLGDLKQWDPNIALLLENFIVENDVKQKFKIWSKIIDHILLPLGGSQPISENNCNCSICVKDLKNLSEKL